MIIKIAKGFNDKLQCNPNGTPFQFEVGKEYAEPFASLCSHGFHGCENPIDCFTYYPPGTSRYCDAELDATTETKSEDTKRVGKHIKIGAEIGIKGIIDGTIKFIFDKCNSSSETTATTGDRANAATTGCSANAATTGYRANAATTGCRANAATTGYSANAATTGYRANASVFNGVAAAIGINGAAKGKLGCFIMLAEWIEDDDYNWVLKTAKSHKVDNKTIMEDVYYKLENGKFIEAEI